MQTLTAGTVQDAANRVLGTPHLPLRLPLCLPLRLSLRLLRNAQLKRRLNAHRMVTYTAIADVLAEAGMLMTFRSHWRAFFPDVEMEDRTDPGDLFALAADFMHMVDEHLFPLEWYYIDGVYQCNGNVMEVVTGPIAFQSYGIECEETHFLDLEGWKQPVVSLLTGGDDSLVFWEQAGIDILHELQKRDHADEGLTWPLHTHRAIAALEQLEPPLNGLAVAYQCVKKASGNIFFDQVGAFWRGLYWDDEFYWCCEEDIRTVKRHYDNAKADIDKLKAYIDWYESNDHAASTVAQIFLDMEDGEW